MYLRTIVFDSAAAVSSCHLKPGRGYLFKGTMGNRVASSLESFSHWRKGKHMDNYKGKVTYRSENHTILIKIEPNNYSLKERVCKVREAESQSWDLGTSMLIC